MQPKYYKTLFIISFILTALFSLFVMINPWMIAPAIIFAVFMLWMYDYQEDENNKLERIEKAENLIHSSFTDYDNKIKCIEDLVGVYLGKQEDLYNGNKSSFSKYEEKIKELEKEIKLLKSMANNTEVFGR